MQNIEPQEPVVRLRGVNLHYCKTAALDDLTLDIPAGRMVGLIGPDGVGKSSLLALVAGAREIQQGEVQVLGATWTARRIATALARESPTCRRAWAKPRPYTVGGGEPYVDLTAGNGCKGAKSGYLLSGQDFSLYTVATRTVGHGNEPGARLSEVLCLKGGYRKHSPHPMDR